MVSPADFVQITKSTKSILPIKFVAVKKIIDSVADLFAQIDLNAKMESTPSDVLAKITDKLRTSPDEISSYISHFKYFKPIYNLATNESATADLNSIKENKANKDFSLNYVDGSISFKREIVMRDIQVDSSFNFGKFSIKMNKDNVLATPMGENTERNGYYHPYVIKNQICLGHYEEPYKQLMNSMNYFAAYECVIQCLTLYGGDDNNGTGNKIVPYQSLSIWIGQLCSVCDETVDIESISLCDKTNRVICPKCVDTGECTDDITKAIFHPDVLKKCMSCDKRTSTVVKSKCIDCRRKSLVEEVKV